MMSPDNFVYDAASALSRGTRERQEDAVAADFSMGSEFGFAVLADGMGGHAAGNVASGIVVTEIFSELKLLSDDASTLERDIQEVLHNAVEGANQCVQLYTQQHPDAYGMGSTLVAPILFDNRLYWISVGDSPLYLFRDGALQRLNQDHSMASRIEAMRAEGLINLEQALNHPDRQALTSVLAGLEIPQIDCRSTPLELREEDILVVASDGLQFLSDEQIADVLSQSCKLPSAHITSRLLSMVEALDHPDQDNVSVCVVKLARFGTESVAREQARPSNVVAVADQKNRTSSYIQISARKNGTGTSSVLSISSKAASR